MNKDFYPTGLAGIFARLAHGFSLRIFLAGLFVLIMGGFFYLSYQTRSFLLSDALVWQLVDSPAIKLIVLASLPSFFHALGWGLLISSLAVASGQQLIKGQLLVLTLSLVLESLLGTYDLLDVLALVAGTLRYCFICDFLWPLRCCILFTGA